MKRLFPFLAAALLAARGDPLPPGASQTIPLWSSAETSALTVFLPPSGRSGTGVVVMPGGGHRTLDIEPEGYAVARWLAGRGIAAFVLEYRLAKAPGSIYRVEVEELQDARRSVRMVRSRAGAWGIDPGHVGVLGFDAGGQLASLLSERYDTGLPKASDPIDHQSCKPAFQALIYPADCEDIAASSASPPAFLVAGFNDQPDISQGIARAYLLFQNVGVSAELHIFAGVGHGFGIAPGPAQSWPDRFRAWLVQSGFANGR